MPDDIIYVPVASGGDQHDPIDPVDLGGTGLAEEGKDVIYVELPANDLPEDAQDIIELLEKETVSLKYWRQIALAYHRSGKAAQCEAVLAAASHPSRDGVQAYAGPEDGNEDRIEVFNAMAALVLRKFLAEGASQSWHDAQRSARQLANRCDLLDGTTRNAQTWVVKGMRCLTDFTVTQQSSSLKEASAHFERALERNPSHVPAMLATAAVHLHQKEWKDALMKYQQVTSAHANCEPVVYLLQAICLYHLGRHEACRKAVKRLRLNYPDNVDALCLEAALEPPTKEGVEESIKHLERAMALDGGHPVVLAQYGEHLYYQAEFDDAEISLANAVRRSSCQRIRAGAEYLRGRIHHEKEEYAKAQERYAECLRQLPDHVPCQFASAQALLALNRMEEAIKLADKVRAVCPKNKHVLRLSAALLCRHPERNAEARKYLDSVPLEDDDLDGWRLRAGAFASGSEAAGPGEMKAALEAYDKVVELTELNEQEVDAEVWNNIGTLRTSVGDFEKAKAALDRAEMQLKARIAAETTSGVALRRLKGLHLTVKFNLGRWYEQSTGFDQIRKARDMYKEIVTACPQYADAWIRLVQQALRRGDFSRAQQFLQDALVASPTNVDLLVLSAEVKEQLGDLDGALAEAEKAFAEGGEDPDPAAGTCLATLHYRKGCAVEGKRKVYREDQRKDRKAASIAKEQSEAHFKKALEIFQKTLASDKGSFYAMNGIGAVLAHKDKRHEAKVIFKSLEENLGERGAEILREVNVAVNQGHLLMDYGRSDEQAFEKAVQYYEQAFSLDPENADIILFLATAYYKVKKSKEAQKTLNWGLFLYPSDPRMHLDYAMLLELHGSKIVADKAANFEPALVKKGADMLTAAASRFEFVQQLRKLRTSPATGEEAAKPAGLSRATLQSLDDLECSYLTASQSAGNFQKNLEKHLDFCLSSAEKATEWADKLEAKKQDDAAKHRLEKKQLEAKKQDEFLREKLREEDKQRHQRIQNERAEALHREMNNVQMPEVSDKPGETKIAPPKRPREKLREEDEAAKQRRVEPAEPAEAAEAAEPAEPVEDDAGVDVLFAELFGDDE